MLSHAKAAINGPRWCTKHCDVCLAAAATDGATATVEQRQLDVLGFHRINERDLGVLQRPARRREAAILVAVGIADHHGLAVPAAIQVLAVKVGGQQVLENVAAAIKVVHCFKQWRDVDWHFEALVMKFAPLRQQQN